MSEQTEELGAVNKSTILSRPDKPAVAPVDPAMVPAELKAHRRWLGWNWKWNGTKWTKPPVNALTGGSGSSTNPDTWCSFDEVMDAECDGIGFALGDAGDVHFAGIDLDDCRDVVTGELTELAREVISRVETYCEVSPSGTGVKLLCIGELPPKAKTKNKAGTIEIYGSGRYFTVTGQHVDGTPQHVESQHDQLNSVWTAYVGTEQPVTQSSGSDVGVAGGALAEMLMRHKPAPTEQDGSKRLFCVACRAVEHDLSDEVAIATIREYEQTYPFPIERSDDDLRQRLRDAEAKAERGSAWCTVDTSIKDLSIVTPMAWNALIRANEPPKLFRYAGVASRVETGDSGEPVVRKLNSDQFRHHLALAAKWIKWDAKKPIHIAPPKEVVSDVMATPDQPLPVLSRIVEAPIFAPDGTLETSPGYHPACQAYYASNSDLDLPDVPEHPTAQDIGKARSLILDELLYDFPFVGDSERAHAMSLLLLPFARDLIAGPTPLHLLEKPTAGTGATLLTDMLAYPAIGRSIPAMSAAKDDEEWRKRITAKLRDGCSFMFIDNVKHRLDSSALSSALTTTIWEDRVLGISEVARLPVRCIWIATGNNPTVSKEVARRTVRIRMDAKVEHPQLRSEFRHPKLRTWAAEHRGDLVWAALTLIRAWIVAGRPKGEIHLGMYDAWSDTMGGILGVAGVPGFLANLKEFYSDSDAEGAEWKGFLSAWYSQYGQKPTAVKDLITVAMEDASELLGTGGVHSQKVTLGKALTERREQVFEMGDEIGRLMIKRSDSPKQGAYQWSLELAV